MNRFMKVLTYPMRHEVEKTVEATIRKIEFAPECCGEPMEYLGEHSGMYMNTQFYQCSKCKAVELLHKHDWEKNK